MEREECHVEQLREKDNHYGVLVGQLKNRIDELEDKLNQMAKRRPTVKDHIAQTQAPLKDIDEDDEAPCEALKLARSNVSSSVTAVTSPPPPPHATRVNAPRHAGLSQRPLTCAATAATMDLLIRHITKD
uniref:Uncharacterized protein n=1 Tax=Ditylenchus dipsaci TaxID=166011 RepID=A0A915EFF5_9BILA